MEFILFKFGFQILSSCDKPMKELERYISTKNGFLGLLNEAFHKILNEEMFSQNKL